MTSVDIRSRSVVTDEIDDGSKSVSKQLIQSATMLYEKNLLHIILVGLGGILTFLPLYLQISSEMENTLFSEALRSSMYRDSCVASLALVIPIIIDKFLDLIESTSTDGEKKSTRATKSTIDDCSFDFREKALFLLGIIVQPITIFLSSETSNFDLIVICCRKCRMILVVGSLACMFSRHAEVISRPLALICITLFVVAVTTGSFSSNMASSSSLHGGFIVIYYVSYAVGYMASLIGFVCCVWWLLKISFSFAKKCFGWNRVGIQEKRSTSFVSAITEVDDDKYLSFRVGFVAVVVTWALFNLGINVNYLSTADLDGIGMAIENLSYIILELSRLLFVMRLVKFEAIQGLYSLLNAKKQYVRYISHEIRTPLNAAYLGLKVLTDDLKKSTNPKDIDRYDTLCDVNLSCITAIDILNDLLTFDKLESGILELHKETVSALSFVEDCVKMFSAQAKSNNIELALDVSNTIAISVGVSASVAVPVTDEIRPLPLVASDVIIADKFKLAQVVRNLISNALKFTPMGGKVTVTASFLPSQIDETDTAGRPVSRSFSRSRLSSSRSFKGNSSVHPPASSIKHAIAVADALAAVIRKASGDKGKDGKVHSSFSVTDERVRGRLRIVVTDTGAGISEENQKKLFKEVVQFNPEKLQAGGGSGFGLFISKNIVDLHGGRISLFSAGEGKGSAFTVDVPMYREARRASSARCEHPSKKVNEHRPSIPTPSVVGAIRGRCSGSAAAAAVAGGGASAGGDAGGDAGDGDGARSHTRGDIDMNRTTENCEKIVCAPSDIPVQNADENDQRPKNEQPKYQLLVVDDSKLNRKLLCKLLTEAGHTWDEADDGVAAVEAVKKKMSAVSGSKYYDAILMDFIMPNLDGPSATKQIRDMGYTMPVLGLTGNGLQSDIDHYIANGADRVFVKPFEIEEFHVFMRQREES